MSTQTKQKSPAFQFYPADYLASARVAMMSLDAEGAYIRAVCYCWSHGSIPSDPERLARLIGKGASTTLASEVAAMFTQHPSDPAALVHERLELERQKQYDWREKSAKGGRKSAETRESQRVLQPPLPNGSNQMATLPSAVFHLLSSSSSSDNPIQGAATAAPVAKALKPRKSVERNPVIDALAGIDGSQPAQVTPGAWSGIGKALAEIKAVCPNVDAAEIARRAENYKAHMPQVTISPLALAKHWAKCEAPPAAASITNRFQQPAATAADHAKGF